MIEKMKSLMLKLNYISCRFIGFTMGRFFMLALALTNKKDFMNKFLKTEIFDHFLLQEGIVVSFASYVIDGTITKGFYTDTEAEELGIKTFHFLPFSMLRPRIFDLIKGKKAPSSFKFILMLSPENQKRTMERIGSSYTPADISAMSMNIKFQNQMLTLTTGISYRIFSTDKTLEPEWDKFVRQFLSQHDISFEVL
ncbi:DUF5721 family protein [Roseburia faecis]|jgi:hypothetical protein|uniref:DUF5721 family protein n=1 Tax=Roseburia faecis TaxID=301302 RepID=UPI000B071630|nr:DUF5721 family protein [Roseburia faecis]